MDERKFWLVVIGDVAARDLARSDWRRLSLDRSDGGPAAGDRIAVLRTHRPAYLTTAVAIGTADVHGEDGDALELRHRVVAPLTHEPDLASLHLRIATPWTHARLGALLGSAVPIEMADYERIERALLEAAHAFGPAPSRPQHRRPRTPGRRAILVARVQTRRAKSAR